MKLGWFAAGLSAYLMCMGVKGLAAQEAPGQLTVKRIYSQPSPSGRLKRGVQWAPDGKRVSFFETSGQGKDAKSELWVMDAANAQKQLLVSAERLKTVLPSAEKEPASQATGLGRRPASQYQWAPDGNGILF